MRIRAKRARLSAIHVALLLLDDRCNRGILLLFLRIRGADACCTLFIRLVELHRYALRGQRGPLSSGNHQRSDHILAKGKIEANFLDARRADGHDGARSYGRILLLQFLCAQLKT